MNFYRIFKYDHNVYMNYDLQLFLVKYMDRKVFKKYKTNAVYSYIVYNIANCQSIQLNVLFTYF